MVSEDGLRHACDGASAEDKEGLEELSETTLSPSKESPDFEIVESVTSDSMCYFLLSPPVPPRYNDSKFDAVVGSSNLSAATCSDEGVSEIVSRLESQAIS